MRITREQAINEVGIEIVTELENSELEHTNRCTEGTEDAGTVEFASIRTIKNDDYDDICMYVFVDDDEAKERDGDNVNWKRAISETAEFELT